MDVVDITSNTFYMCTATLRTHCRSVTIQRRSKRLWPENPVHNDFYLCLIQTFWGWTRLQAVSLYLVRAIHLSWCPYAAAEVRLSTPDGGLWQHFVSDPRFRIYMLAETGNFVGNRFENIGKLLQLKRYKFQILHQLTPVDSFKVQYYFVLNYELFFRDSDKW
jgi:hypothetical protein